MQVADQRYNKNKMPLMMFFIPLFRYHSGTVSLPVLGNLVPLRRQVMAESYFFKKHGTVSDYRSQQSTKLDSVLHRLYTFQQRRERERLESGLQYCVIAHCSVDSKQKQFKL